MNPRVRRLIFIVTAGAVLARLYLLGRDRGFELVARATVSVTLVSLGAWLVHMVLHELAHWAAAVWVGISGFSRGLVGPLGERERIRLGSGGLRL